MTISNNSLSALVTTNTAIGFSKSKMALVDLNAPIKMVSDAS